MYDISYLDVLSYTSYSSVWQTAPDKEENFETRRAAAYIIVPSYCIPAILHTVSLHLLHYFILILLYWLCILKVPNKGIYFT